MNEPSERTERRRGILAVWIGGAFSAALLILGVNGTLSSWTAAIVTNSNNSAASATSVALIETQTAPTNAAATPCNTASTTTNSVTCSTINKYGGIGSSATSNADDAYGAQLSPGGSQAVTVNLKNNGTGSGSLVLSSAACSNHAYPGSTGSDTANFNLCNQMQLAVTCTAPSTFTYSGTVGAFTGGTIGTLAATTSTNCTFTVTLPTTTPPGFASQYLTQALTWTLS